MNQIRGFCKKDKECYIIFVQPPEKRYGISVSPLRVLIDPTALPRDGFRVDRKIGLLMSGAEGCLVAAAIFIATSTGRYDIGIYTYLLLRMMGAASTYMLETHDKKN